MAKDRAAAQWNKWFLPSELCNMIINECESNLDLSDGVTGGGLNRSTRDSQVGWIPKIHWINGVIWHYVWNANQEVYNYDITGIHGSVQYTTYSPNEYYTWHCDDMNGFEDIGNRKLSVSIQLSDASEYEGGEFQMRDNDNKNFFAPKAKGSIIVFDSRLQHRVKPVTSGVRKSLVAWCRGPEWQ